MIGESAHGSSSGLVGQEESGCGVSDIILRNDSFVGPVEDSG